MEADYWAHQYADKKVTETFEDDDFDEAQILEDINNGDLDLSQFDDVIPDQAGGAQ